MAPVSSNTFVSGLRDGYPPYAIAARPQEPQRPGAAYGGGVLASGIGSVGLGAAPLGGLYLLSKARQAKGGSGAVGTVPLVLAGLWALPHVVGGVASAAHGLHVLVKSGGGNPLPTAPGPREAEQLRELVS